MTARVAAGLLVSALIRRVEAVGGHAMILARGDGTSGAIMIVTLDRGAETKLYERTLGADGYAWAPTGPAAIDVPGALTDYIARRRRLDPDLWVVEIDHKDAIEIARDMLA